jgi:hypothetical protein
MTHTETKIPVKLDLHVGDWVIVRSKEEILSTLDERACLDELPFQHEMLNFCGQRMRVAKVAHKTCDNIKKTGGRRMLNAVHLEHSRCDGASHGGCQADCVFFWKEVWLRRETDEQVQFISSSCCTESIVKESTRAVGYESKDDPVWVCQTTKLYDATTLLHWWDIRQYIRDVTSGNHNALNMIRLLIFATYRMLFKLHYGHRYLKDLYNAFQKIRGGKPFPLGDGMIPDGKPTPTEILDLQPGEWVEVRSPNEILATITHNGFNRGMRYDMEMSKYSGERYRVQMRVNRLINEVTGKMMIMKNPCIQLENVYCRAECTNKRIGCPRASNTYWREIWLRRVNGPISETEKS